LTSLIGGYGIIEKFIYKVKKPQNATSIWIEFELGASLVEYVLYTAILLREHADFTDLEMVMQHLQIDLLPLLQLKEFKWQQGVVETIDVLFARIILVLVLM
jgi:hypothetical protein